MYNVDTLDKGTIHIPERMERDDVRFHQATQDSVEFKTYELFVEFFIYCFCALVDCRKWKPRIRGDHCTDRHLPSALHSTQVPRPQHVASELVRALLCLSGLLRCMAALASSLKSVRAFRLGEAGAERALGDQCTPANY